MSNIAQAHSLETINAKEWALMLGAPQDHLVRAPSSTPFLASKARFVRSIDIPYSVNNLGKYAVVAFPNALNSLAVTGNALTIPAAGTTTLEVISSQSGFKSTAGQSYVDQGLAMVTDPAGVSLGTTTVSDLGLISPVFAGLEGVRITVVPGSTIVVNVEPHGSYARSVKMRCRFCYINGGVYQISETAAASGATYQFSNTMPAGATLVGFALQNYSLGSPTVNSRDYYYDVEVLAYGASIPVSTATLNMGITSTQLVEAGKVGLQRCTAMSMLVTNLAPPLQSGGEVIMARSSANLLRSARGVTDLGDAIKALPEQLYWRSGAVQEGGYAWWLPDDLDSYEPRTLGETPDSDNILISTGTMSEGGLLRIIVTWTFEFYTPVQLFQRGYNCAYADAHKDMWLSLARQPACSGNPGHIALLKAVASVAASIYGFYQANKQIIDPAARLASKQVSKGIKKMSGTQKGTNAKVVKQTPNVSAPPPLPPKPPRLGK